MKNLGSVRKKIDGIDLKIAALLQKRAAVSKKVAGIKHQQDKKIYDPAREVEVLKNVLAVKGDLSPEGLKAIYNEIMSESRKLQKKNKRGISGSGGVIFTRSSHEAFRETDRIPGCKFHKRGI
jgi:chorismate mutase